MTSSANFGENPTQVRAQEVEREKRKCPARPCFVDAQMWSTDFREKMDTRAGSGSGQRIGPGGESTATSFGPIHAQITTAFFSMPRCWDRKAKERDGPLSEIARLFGGPVDLKVSYVLLRCRHAGGRRSVLAGRQQTLKYPEAPSGSAIAASPFRDGRIILAMTWHRHYGPGSGRRQRCEGVQLSCGGRFLLALPVHRSRSTAWRDGGSSHDAISRIRQRALRYATPSLQPPLPLIGPPLVSTGPRSACRFFLPKRDSRCRVPRAVQPDSHGPARYILPRRRTACCLYCGTPRYAVQR
ncbi:hypothetical protein B0J12DRAFT_69161 [Macrophomina phaseolina]|uniref:Uncharacterized protein n=1 Tax=Macrophomina phaseolina TaxID=35725 RepID=A0ABQ8GD41_9PEZI|nr:hypothetical protein B0J12DRAFT_69161 [Macrophomina phaseolina]